MENRRKGHSQFLGALTVPAGGLLLAFSGGANLAVAQPVLPSGASIVAGTASISNPNAEGMLIVQSSQKAIINWQDFSIGTGGTVTFRQPGSSAIALNRVAGPGASGIDGTLLGNGQVWLVNGNGILFGQSSRIDVGGLIATTSDIRDSDFLAGQYTFGTAPGNPDAGVVNKGSIKAATGGSVVMSAPHVANRGMIEAKLGQIVLGGANAFSVDFDGDNLIRYAVTGPVSQTPKEADGSPADALVSNSGTVAAQGGKILMTARAARDVVNNVVNSTGMIEARSASVQNGEIVLAAGDGGTVNLAGTADASGKDAGETGGSVTLLADKITVSDTASLDASGDAGGGTVLIGGNLHGAGPLPNAQGVTVGHAFIAADAIGEGRGGTVAITSTGTTHVAASVSAKGGIAGGDGGVVETSGHDLDFGQQLHIDTSASRGATGLWLLDPADVDIDIPFAAGIVSQVATSNVTVQAGHDISVNAPIVYSSVNSLTFLAGHNLTFNAGVQNGGAGAIFGAAGWDGVTAPAGILSTPGAFGGNGGSVLIGGAAASGGVAVGSKSGATTIAARDLAVTASLGYAQLGYNDNSAASGGHGSITADLTGNLTLSGGANGVGLFAQIGHGGYPPQTSHAAAIAVTAGGTIVVTGGNGSGAYALIGNGGFTSFGDQGGDVIVAAGGDVLLAGGQFASTNMAQIGNNGDIISGKVVLTSGGNITIAPAASLRATGTGDAVVVAAAGDFSNQAGNAALNVSGGGRWLVFLNNPANDKAAGLSGSPFYNRAFNFSTGAYVPVAAAGNRFVYAIAPAVTIAIDSKTKVYGSANPTITASISGGLAGDSPAGVYTGTPVLGTTAVTGSNAGDYAITGSLGTLVSDYNYGFQFLSGNLQITPAALTYVSGSASRTYGAANPAFTGTVTGFVNGDSQATATSGTLAFTSPATAASGIGTYAVTGSGLTANNGNYSFVQAAANATALTVNPATLAYVASATTRSYGAANPALAGTVTGFVNGDSLATATSGTLAFTSPATAASGIGTYAVTGSGLTANNGNYSFVQAAANATALTINPATLAYVAGTASRTYGAANPALGGTVTGFVNGDSQATATSGILVFTSPATAASGVGTYAVNGSGLTANNGNYSFVQAAANAAALTVNPATLAYVASATTRSYGAANPALAGTVTGFVNGDSQATATSGILVFTSPATATSNVGSYAINGSGLTANNGNYSFVQAAANAAALTVNPATLAYVASATTRSYGAANPALAGTVTGFVNGDSQATATSGILVFTSPATATSNVGSYAINGSGLTANNGNYSFVQAAANASALTINPATLTYLSGSASRTYGAANPALGGTVTGFVNGDSQATATSGILVFTSPATATSNVGSYAINGSGLTANNGNYSFVQAAANASALTINPATLTYLSGSASRTYGAANPALGGTVTGFVNGDSQATATSGILVFTSPATAASGVGTYAVTGSGLTANNGNYSFVQAAANATALTINPATLTVNLTGTVQKAYDGTTAATLAAANYTLTGIISGDSVTLNNPVDGLYDSADIGTGKVVTVSGLALLSFNSGNYVLASSNTAGAVGIILSPGFVTDLLGKTYTTGGVPGVVNISIPQGEASGSQSNSDATSSINDTTQGDFTDTLAVKVGQSLSGEPGSVQSTSVVEIDGILRRMVPPPGGMSPHGVPPEEQAFSSWGNEALWQ